MDKNPVTIYQGTSKKTGKEYTAILVTVGEWSKLIFPTTKFELDYIKNKLAQQNDGDNFLDDIS